MQAGHAHHNSMQQGTASTHLVHATAQRRLRSQALQACSPLAPLLRAAWLLRWWLGSTGAAAPSRPCALERPTQLRQLLLAAERAAARPQQRQRCRRSVPAAPTAAGWRWRAGRKRPPSTAACKAQQDRDRMCVICTVTGILHHTLQLHGTHGCGQLVHVPRAASSGS